MKFSSFRRFFITGDLPKAHDLDEQVERHRFKPIDVNDSEQVRALGFCVAGSARVDGQLVQRVGQYLVLGVRIDELRVASGTLKHRIDEECRRVLLEQKLERLNRYQVAEIKERVTQDLRKRVVPAIKTFSIVLDPDGHLAYVGTTNKKTLEEMQEILEQVTGVGFWSDGCYPRALRLHGDDLDQLQPVDGLQPFDLAGLLNGGVDAAEADEDLPRGGGDLLDRMLRAEFLGPEFLLWLWWRSDVQGGVFDAGGEFGPFELWFDDKLVLSTPCVNAMEDTFDGGHPISSVEARAALRVGKVPQMARIRIVRASQEWSMVLRAGGLALDSLKVPAVLSREEDEVLAERMLLIEQVETMLDALYRQFLDLRLGEGPTPWVQALGELRAWVLNDDAVRAA